MTNQLSPHRTIRKDTPDVICKQIAAERRNGAPYVDLMIKYGLTSVQLESRLRRARLCKEAV